ncbi:MAG TPA: hypothetical protein VGZ03_05130 [Acidimicrobiales bacterium]|nr:hypothetical protein [Acidimicrobiales bacterium]
MSREDPGASATDAVAAPRERLDHRVARARTCLAHQWRRVAPSSASTSMPAGGVPRARCEGAASI